MYGMGKKMMNERRSGLKKSDVVDGDDEEDEEKTMVALGRPKGLPNLDGLSSNNKRSLFN